MAGQADTTPAERAFTVDIPDPPPPPPPPAGPGPAPGGPAALDPLVPLPPTPKLPAKLKVLRAGIDDGTLDMLLDITSLAATSGAELKLDYHSAGKHTKFTVPIKAAARAAAGTRPDGARRGGADQDPPQLPSSQRSKSTGIVTIDYAGNSQVQPDEVRLRAADNHADLKRGTVAIRKGRLVVDGKISDRASGVVRIRLGYALPDASTAFKTWNAEDRRGPVEDRQGAARRRRPRELRVDPVHGLRAAPHPRRADR